MSEHTKPDWDPRAPEVLENQEAAYDAMRRKCPIAHSEYLGWSVFRYEDVLTVLLDHETFGNAVSRHRSVPNGMDPPEHGPYRSALEPFLTQARLDAFEPTCRALAIELVERALVEGQVDWLDSVAEPFALRCQCAFVGWPEALAAPIRAWTRRNHEATLAGDRGALAAVAAEFDGHVAELLAVRRASGAPAQDDVLAGLLEARVQGKALTDEDIASVLRNWTVGEVGSLAAALGTVVRCLATNGPLQERLREEPNLLPRAIDEILRISGPLVANRRIARRDVELGGRRIRKGERLSVLWVSANRDETVFPEPEELRLDREGPPSLLYGAGIHVCPGAELAGLQLRVALEELLSRTARIELVSGATAERATYPANGWSTLRVALVRGSVRA